MKPRYKRRIFWTTITIVATLALAIVIVPPMITLNSLKPQLHSAIATATGINTKINGPVHFSLLGGATIIAHDIATPYGNIGSAMFNIPLSSVFNDTGAKLSGDITIYNGDLKISDLGVAPFTMPIEVYNSTINFHNKDYEIIRASINGTHIDGTVRTNDHKYDIKTDDDKFVITNKNNNLEIIGTLYDNGGATGTISIDTDNINRFFEFDTPKIPGRIAANANFTWDGNNAFDFTNINADNFAGNIELMSDGKTIIQLSSPDINYDFSFLTDATKIFTNTDLNLDLYGNLKFGPRTFNHLKIIASATPKKFKIENIIADDITIAGGYIDEGGAHNIMITLPYDGARAMCIFSGTPRDWRCSAFSYNNMTGSISVSDDKYDIVVQSTGAMQDIDGFMRAMRRFGKNGTVHFSFANMAGNADVSTRDINITYSFANDKTLSDMGYDIKFIPEFMRSARGNFAQKDGATIFTPRNGNWNITFNKNAFVIHGDSFKQWLPNLDLQSVNDFQYTISGNYSDRAISDLTIEIADMKLTGTFSGNTLTLHTDILNIDTIANQEFITRFGELEFLTTHPIVVPFDVPINISLSANKMVYGGISFANFVYSLKDDIQTFSISDSDRGNLLATIARDKTNYEIFIQMNRFLTNGNLLTDDMPLNIRDTMITSEISMRTNGYTAHDLIYNLRGDIDMTFNGGYVIGLGMDNFFANANTLTAFNIEYALSDALTSGESRLKKMRIVGKYENGNFITSQPFTIQIPHTDCVGELDISDGKMMVMLNMTLRGTSPEPQPIRLRVLADGTRDYSLSDIMNNFDAGFMRAFIKIHDKF